MRVFLVTSALFLISLCSAAHRKTRDSQEDCFTPWGSPGSCIPLIKCNHLLNILISENRKSNPTFDFLPKFYCGRDGNTLKYCCEFKEEESLVNYQQSPPEEINQPSSYQTDLLYHNNRKLLNEDICGKVIDNESNEKIFEYPWSALLVYGNEHNSNIKFRCGGSIINNRYVLTAAHCVTEHPNNDTLIGVRVGVQNWSNIRHCEKEGNDVNQFCADYQDIYIESSEYHPQFSRATLENNVALLRLEKNIDFSQGNARSICLPIGSAATLTKNRVVITGWGILESGPQHNELLDTILFLVPNEQCAKIYQGYRKIGKSLMCVGGKNQKKCIGDNGGPLQSPANYNGEFRHVQYGIKNFENSLCSAQFVTKYPNIYTRVDYYMDWILDTIRE